MKAAAHVPVPRAPLEHRGPTLAKARAEVRAAGVAELRVEVHRVVSALERVRAAARAGARIEPSTVEALTAECLSILADVDVVLAHRELLAELEPTAWRGPERP